MAKSLLYKQYLFAYILGEVRLEQKIYNKIKNGNCKPSRIWDGAPAGVYIMYVVSLLEVEGSGFPEHQYCTYSGKGIHKRSVKKAMDAARKALRRSYRTGGSRKDPMWTGTPTYDEVLITHNGKEFLWKF